jgi:hypothetical protein
MITLENQLLELNLHPNSVTEELKPILRKTLINALIEDLQSDEFGFESKIVQYLYLKEYFLTISSRQYESLTYLMTCMLFNNQQSSYIDTIRTKKGLENTLIIISRNHTVPYRCSNFEELMERIRKKEDETIEFLNWANKDSVFVAKNITPYFNTDTVIWLGNGIYILCKINFIVAPYSALNNNTATKLYALLGKLAIKNGLNKEHLDEIKQRTPNWCTLTNAEKDIADNFLLVYNTTRYITAFERNVSTYTGRLRDQQDEAIRRYEDAIRKYRLFSMRAEKITHKFKETIEEAAKLITQYKSLNYISKFKIEIDNNYLKIYLRTKILPVLYLDDNVLESSYKSDYYYEANQECRENIKRYIETRDINFAVGPCKTSIYIPLDPEARFQIEFSSLSRLPINGHAQFHCLGTFAQPIIDASDEMDVKKVVALAIQYLQSISPHDLAGRRTINEQIILDENNETILFVYGDSRNKSLEGKKLSEISYTDEGRISL